MDIKHARRLLVIGHGDCGSLDVIKDLTGSTPPLNDASTTAGLTHEWTVSTAYYKATVPIWVDDTTDLERWTNDFLLSEAGEVVRAVGAWVYCFRTSIGEEPSQEVRDTMRAVDKIMEKHGTAGPGGDSVMLAVAMPSGQASSGNGQGTETADWEDACMEHGFEYVDYRAKGTNGFGETQGFERLKEALEANEWAAGVEPDIGSDFDDLDFGEEEGLEDAFTRQDEAEMTAELFGMKAALAGAEDLQYEDSEAPMGMGQGKEKEVDDLDRLMGRLLAVKEQSADLPEAQRRRMAAQAVREVMGEG